MAVAGKPSLAELSARLGHDFADPAHLKLALTHASARAGAKPNEDNERLEFLGDRVLGLAVAELLADRFPDASEGELARWFNHLVRAETCAEVAQDWDLGRFIVMSGGEAGSGGRYKKTILANTCEAVLGAVFADGGYAAAREMVRRSWEPHLSEIDLAAPDAKVSPAGMGTRAAPASAPLSRSCARGARPRAALYRRGADRGRRADTRAGCQQTRG